MDIPVAARDLGEGEGSYDGSVVGDRFGVGYAPTLLARTASVAPVGFNRLRNEDGRIIRAKNVPPESAFTLHVALQPTQADLWIDGRHTLSAAAQPGDAFLFDLNSDPVSEHSRAFDNMRFYISRASLDELAADHGGRAPSHLAMPRFGANDRVMHGLAMALLDPVEQAGEHSTLFIDHIALAFHAHLIHAYGDVGAPRTARAGRLSPWQLRRALDYMTAHLDGDPTVAQLARECGLSAGYFARAFRATTGVTPHQWLIRRRVARARELLLTSRLELAHIALTCGFVDQSHLTRVFVRFQGDSPGRWRRRHQI